MTVLRKTGLTFRYDSNARCRRPPCELSHQSHLHPVRLAHLAYCHAFRDWRYPETKE